MTAPRTLFGRSLSHVHLIGAGGMGMAPLGIYLAQLGLSVTAEDDGWNPAVRDLLVPAGVNVVPAGVLPENAELVVYSSAVAAIHPTRQAATARAVPQVRRGEMLAEVVQGKKLIAIAGSHGKTTTTAMLITALQNSGFPCSWVLGGLFQGDTLPPAHAGAGEWVVAEIDESDGTIGRFSPAITVAVNLDWDHADHYARLADLEAAFAALFARTSQAVFVSDRCELSARLTQGGVGRATVHTFGKGGDYQGSWLEDGPAGLTIRLGGRFAPIDTTVPVHGEFNASNATAALAVAQHLGAALTPTALANFPGVRRRQTRLHEGAVTIYEDYAHHPTEIRALLGSLAGRRGAGRLVVVFQPHRYSRTAQFKAEFAAALGEADQLFLMEVYAASEAPLAGGTTADLFAEFEKSGTSAKVTYLPDDEAGLRRALAKSLQPGDTLVFVGAGDIEQTAQAFVATWVAREKRELAWVDLVSAVRPRLSVETKFTERELLGAKTTMRVGGPARVYAEPATVEDLRRLLRAVDQAGLPLYLLGRGSNLIVPDEGVDGLVISLAHEAWQQFEVQANGRVWVGAGLRLKNLCGLATKAGLKGFEFLEGIPGAVGGALRMNAGAMGGWMFEVVDEVRLMTRAGEVRDLKKDQLHVAYRHCAELETAIALGAWIRPVAQADAEAVRAQVAAYQKKRVESQPREPSAGCIFKNPPGTSAGRLIDESGLKGERVGDAEVSPVHANFIVNRGHATSADIIGLVRRIRARVKTVKGVDLEPEVLLYGQEWRDVL